MTSLESQYSQVNPNYGFYRTIVNTVWLYPQGDIDKALLNTSAKFTYDGVFIICPDMNNLLTLYYNIFEQTAISQPVGNVGFSLGVGTMCQNFGRSIYWKLEDTSDYLIKWQLVQQITPQTTDNIPVPGNSPEGTVGYLTTFNPIGYTNILDAAYVSLTG